MWERKMRSRWNLKFAAITHQNVKETRNRAVRKWIAIEFQCGREDGIKRNENKKKICDNLLDDGFWPNFKGWRKKMHDDCGLANMKGETSANSFGFDCVIRDCRTQYFTNAYATALTISESVRQYSNKRCKLLFALYLNGAVHVWYKFKFQILVWILCVCVIDQWL